VRVRLIDKATGKSVAGLNVDYTRLPPNSDEGRSRVRRFGPEGYQMPVPPGPILFFAEAEGKDLPTSVRLDVCKMPANLAANQGVVRPAEPQGSSVRPSPSSSVGGPATTAQPRTGTAGPDARRAVPSVVIVALRVSACHRLGRALNSGRVGPSTWS
jgi:hypothetical protein